MSKLTREARDMGYVLENGSKHWKLRHLRSGYTTTLPYGSKLSFRDERNIRSRLRRGANGGLA
jgi:hypothetical protein